MEKITCKEEELSLLSKIIPFLHNHNDKKVAVTLSRNNDFSSFLNPRCQVPNIRDIL
jgi:hypothetical protein